jgi:hypothetical protein
MCFVVVDGLFLLFICCCCVLLLKQLHKVAHKPWKYLNKLGCFVVADCFLLNYVFCCYLLLLCSTAQATPLSCSQTRHGNT